MILDQTEMNYLKSLQKNPVWNNILTKLSIYTAPPLYKGNEDDFNSWVYQSGVLKGVKGIISILKTEETTLTLEEKK